MDHVPQAEHDFVDAVRILFDVQENLRTKRCITYAGYDGWVSARLWAWITLARLRAHTAPPLKRFVQK